MAGEGQVYAFGSFQVDPTRRSILRTGRAVRVTAKVFDLLLALIRSRDRVLTREELMAELWPDTIVEDGNLSVNISALRKALEDRGTANPFIETLPRLGYRFVAEVSEEPRSVALASAEASPAERAADDTVSRSAPGHRGFGEMPRVNGLHAICDDGRPQTPLPPFVGRERELKKLRDSFELARSGVPQIVFIHGEPGIGKTSLAERFIAGLAANARDVRVATGRCLQQHGAGEAYLPFLGVFGTLLSGQASDPIQRLFSEHASSWCRHFPGVFTPTSGATDDLAGKAAGQQLLRQAQQAICAMAAQTPLVIFLEDLHWADPSSVDLLRLLGQQAVRRTLGDSAGSRERGRWIVIGTFRTAEVGGGVHPLAQLVHELRIHGQCGDLPLKGLRRESIEVFLRERFGAHRLPPDLVALLLQKTEGHPLLCTRLLEWLVDHEDIVWDGEAFGLPRPLSELFLEVPESVESLILRKLDLLTLEDQRVLTYASIEGEEFTSTILAELLGEDEVDLDERLERLARVHRWFDLVGEETWPSGRIASRYRFSHALYRDYLHSKFVPKRRRQLHQRAALALIEHHRERAPGIAALLAAHFEESGDVERAVVYHIHAGHNATASFALREAEVHYSQALLNVESLPREDRLRHQLQLLRERAWRRGDQGDYQGTVDDFARLTALSEEAGDDLSRWEAVWGSALTCLVHLDRERCREHQRTLCQLASESGDERRNVEALNYRAAVCLGFDDDLQTARQHLTEGLRIGRGLGKSVIEARGRVVDHQRALVVNLQLSARLDSLQGYHQAAVAKYSELIDNYAPTVFVGSEMAVTFHYERGLAQLNLGRISRACADFESAGALAERVQSLNTLGAIRNCIAGVHLELEDYPVAMRRSREVLEMPLEHADAYARVHAALDLALAHLRCPARDCSEAELALAEAESIVNVTCEMRGAHPPPGRAANRYRGYRLVGKLRSCSTRGELLLARSELDAATQSARELIALAGPQCARKHMALGHWLLARVALARGSLAEAKLELSTGLEVLVEGPCPRLAWRLWADLGRTELGLADGVAARAALDCAVAGIEQIALGIEDAGMRDTFVTSPSVQRTLQARS